MKIKFNDFGRCLTCCKNPCECKIKLPCLNCGKIHEFDKNSNEANNIFNVFCNNECEDKYAFKQ